MSIAERYAPAPARDYPEALARFAALAARDDRTISSAGRSRFYGHGRRTERAVVFVHGLTNCPQQWEWFGLDLHAAGYSVVVPRLPGHGHFYRATRAQARPDAAQLLEAVSTAVDVAVGAAEDVTVVGLSIGGTMAPWLALHRTDIAHAIGLVPFFAPKALDRTGTRRLVRTALALPNAFIPWDPGGDDAQIPPYGYPRFSTHVLAQCLRVGEDVAVRLEARAQHTGTVTFVLNAREPACNNTVTLETREELERIRPGSTRVVTWTDLPDNHDLIDPTNPRRRVDLVYPRLRALIAGEPAERAG